MDDRVRELMAELKAGLETLYSGELVGVYLYGSHARGEARSESDVDVLVVLRRLDHYGSHIDRTSELIAGLSLKYEVAVSRVFTCAADWSEKDSPFLANVREEAIAA